MAEALTGFGALLLLIMLRLPIAFAMALVGFAGCAYLIGFDPAVSIVGQIAIDTGFSYEFSILPLFILMGNFISRSGISDDLYDACHAFLGHMRGGLATATIVACGGFSAVSGSSLATAATMAKVAMPPMRQRGYADALASGAIAAGGTLGILIPPSTILVVYGIITETNIGQLFIAGILPGALATLAYASVVVLVTWIRPELGPAGERTGWHQRLRFLRKVWIVLLLFVTVIGGIYAGVFTATEAAGIGATASFVIALLRRSLTFTALRDVLVETTQTAAMVFSVLFGALVFANFVNLTGLPNDLTSWVMGLGVGPYVVLLVILLIYLVLGCALDTMAMVLLTVPTFFPLMTSLGFHPIWFGIIVVVVSEISLITPPVGMNVFVIRAVLRDVPAGTIFRGVAPFVCADIVRLALLILFPSIIMLLPQLMVR